MPGQALRALGQEAGLGWTNPTNMLHDDGTYATTTSLQNSTVYNHDFTALPDDITVKGIIVRVDAHHSGGNDDMQVGVEMTWNTGSNWTLRRDMDAAP
jgi:hypothetical protein